MPSAPRHRAPMACANCQVILPPAVFNAGPVVCPACRVTMEVEVFPAFFRPLAAGQAAENILSDEDASCFYHASKKAVVPCGRCGRFLCALCDIDLGTGHHVCPGCVEAARLEPAAKLDANTAVLVAPRRTRHDLVALAVSLLPLVLLFLWPVTLFTAPYALFLVIRYWNEPKRALLPHNRAALIFAAFFALLTLAGWAIYGASYLSRHIHDLG